MADRSDLLVGKSSHLRRNCLSLTILAALGCTPLAATLALAQEAPDESEYEIVLEEVIVTGSRIVNEEGFGRTSPVTVVGMDEIESFGLTRIEDVLNSLPQIQADQTSFLSNGSSGTATLNLRGGYVEGLRSVGLVVELKEEARLQLPAYRGPLRFRSAKPLP